MLKAIKQYFCRHKVGYVVINSIWNQRVSDTNTEEIRIVCEKCGKHFITILAPPNFVRISKGKL